MFKFVSKNWGYEKIIINNDKFCGKILHVVRDKHSSVHFHKIKHEAYYIQSGKLKVSYLKPKEWFHLYDDEKSLDSYIDHWTEVLYRHSKILTKDSILDIPPFTIHQFTALEQTEIFEVSTPHSDDDVYRIIKGN